MSVLLLNVYIPIFLTDPSLSLSFPFGDDSVEVQTLVHALVVEVLVAGVVGVCIYVLVSMVGVLKVLVFVSVVVFGVVVV